MDRRLPAPKRVTSPTWGPPPPCKQAPRKRVRAVSNFITLVPFHTSFLMLGNSSGVDSKELYLSSEKERENCCLASTFSIVKLETVEVSRGSRATIDGKLESTKKRDTHAGLLFCLSKPIAFSPFSLPSPSLSPLLKFPIGNGGRTFFNFIIPGQQSFLVLILVTRETEKYIFTFKHK